MVLYIMVLLTWSQRLIHVIIEPDIVRRSFIADGVFNVQESFQYCQL